MTPLAMILTVRPTSSAMTKMSKPESGIKVKIKAKGAAATRVIRKLAGTDNASKPRLAS